jgi:UrcA family protein
MKKVSTTLLAVASVATCTFATVQADPAFAPRSMTVHFEDLNTANLHGVSVLYQRIKSAAESVCRDLEPARSLAGRRQYSDCQHMAISHAVADINLPAVTSFAAARGVLRADTAIRVARGN